MEDTGEEITNDAELKRKREEVNHEDNSNKAPIYVRMAICPV